jgi:hypothetical protein
MTFRHNGSEFTNDKQKEVYKEKPPEIKNRYFLLLAKCNKCDKMFRMKVLKADWTNNVFCTNCNVKGIKNYGFTLVKKEYPKTQFLSLLKKDDITVIQDEQTSKIIS